MANAMNYFRWWVRTVSVAVSLVMVGCAAGRSTAVYPEKPGRYNRTLTLDGMQRSYVLHLPKSYQEGEPLPVVFMLHGGGGTGRAALWETGWHRLADEQGFIMVAPNAMPPDHNKRASFASNPQLWNDGSDRFYAEQVEVDDVRFINAIIDELNTYNAVDAQRIFVTGFSNGASMAFRAAAALPDRIAAIAPVAGACWIDPGELARPVPMLYITGDADPLNLIEGGVPLPANSDGTTESDKVRAKAKPPVRDSVEKWARANGCPVPGSQVTEKNGVRTETWQSCPAGGVVEYIQVKGLGHTWAGGKSILPESIVGGRSELISATEVIWEFFRQHPRTSGEAGQPLK